MGARTSAEPSWTSTSGATRLARTATCTAGSTTHTRASFYFPPPELYRGRFFQYLEGGSGGHEQLLPTQPWTFRLAFEDLGGYLVESNQGHFPNEGMGFANDWELFGASAASAIFAKQLAAEMYGAEPHHGYVWGGSGGGSRSIYCLENRPDVYDGASPHVIWSSPLGSSWSPIGYWWLHRKLDDIIDAVEPGGSGDPFATLSHDEREALAALYRYGFPRGGVATLVVLAMDLGIRRHQAERPRLLRRLLAHPRLPRARRSAAARAPRDRHHDDRAEGDRGRRVDDRHQHAARRHCRTAREHSVGITLDREFDDLEALFGARDR